MLDSGKKMSFRAGGEFKGYRRMYVCTCFTLLISKVMKFEYYHLRTGTNTITPNSPLRSVSSDKSLEAAPDTTVTLAALPQTFKAASDAAVTELPPTLAS